MQIRPVDLLLFGHDSQLTYSRVPVLRQAGYCVASVDTYSSFQSAYFHGPSRIILLCQTLSPEECHSCEAFAKELNPHVLPLVLFNQRCKYVPGVGGVLLRSASGPAMLLNMVHEMLNRSTPVAHAAAAQEAMTLPVFRKCA